MIKIYQIETSAFCNASCSFCPHSKMTRKQGDMSAETFSEILSIIDNDYVALHHFGEPLLNPLLPKFIEWANDAGIETEFSTNGGTLKTESTLIAALKAKPCMIRYATDHRENFDSICEILYLMTNNNVSTIIKTHSVLQGTKPFTNFAGAVPGKSKVSGECYFKKYKYCCVLWNGDVVPCCADYDGKEIIGNVYKSDQIAFKDDYEICRKCSGMQFAEGGKWHVY